MKLNEIKTYAARDLNAEIEDAASSIGTIKELTKEVREKVFHYLDAKPSLAGMGDGDLQSLLNRTKGEDKFALLIACKVAGRRLPEDAAKLRD